MRIKVTEVPEGWIGPGVALMMEGETVQDGIIMEATAVALDKAGVLFAKELSGADGAVLILMLKEAGPKREVEKPAETQAPVEEKPQREGKWLNDHGRRGYVCGKCGSYLPVELFKFTDRIQRCPDCHTRVKSETELAAARPSPKAAEVAPPARSAPPQTHDASLHKIQFDDESDLEELDELAEMVGAKNPREDLERQTWLSIAYCALGKAEMIDQGRFNMGEEDDKDLPVWAEQLRKMAGRILDAFQPGDMKL